MDDLYFARSFQRHGAFALLSSDVTGERVATSTNLFCPLSAAVRNGKHAAGLPSASRENCRPLSSATLQAADDTLRHLRTNRCVAVLSFLEEGRPLSRSPPIVGAVVDDNDDDYDVLSSAITAQVAL